MSNVQYVWRPFPFLFHQQEEGPAFKLKNKPKVSAFKLSVNICSCVKRHGVTHPSYRLHLSTHVRPRIKYLQERHWSGPGPQHPASEHSGSHTMCFLAAHEKDRQKHKSKIRFHVRNSPTNTEDQGLCICTRLPLEDIRRAPSQSEGLRYS